MNSNFHQVGVVEFLLNNGADVHAKDKVCLLRMKTRLKSAQFTRTQLYLKRGHSCREWYMHSGSRLITFILDADLDFAESLPK